MTKKEQIIEVASTLFSKKGYDYTSVDEISKECGISKGSFYKYFQSKEELILEILQCMPTELSKALQKLYSSNLESSTEKLSTFVSMALKSMVSNKTHFSFDIFSIIPTLVINKLEDRLRDIDKEINKYIKEFFLHLYGDEINDYTKDLIYLLRGITFQYALINRSSSNLDLQKCVNFIVTTFEIIVYGILEKHPEPFLQSNWEINEISDIDSPLIKELRIQHLIKKIQSEINSSQISHYEKDQYLKAISMLTEECRFPEPKEFLVNALITYLKSLPAIEKDCNQLMTELYN